MESEVPVIRQAVTSDGPIVASLLGQLGYPQSTVWAEAKIRAMEGRRSDRLWVASLGSEVVGFLSVHVFEFFHADGMMGRITAMAVDEKARGRGVGRALVGEAEDFCIGQGCVRLELTSGDRRVGAHTFYEKLGFEVNAKRFQKFLVKADGRVS